MTFEDVIEMAIRARHLELFWLVTRILSKEGAPKLRSLFEYLEGVQSCSPLMAYDRACLRDGVIDILVTMSC